MTNDATPILECAFSLAGPLPAPVSYVNFPPYGETELRRRNESPSLW
jgi:hypothetical protein